ncbi:hypothetical protein GCM10009665_73450 [Kitasatospora nipponensis]|uniref:Secreted protein n=2 Tax=Kitasatospora nipponensis TaxID=258049 RepID=A0ABN1X0F8_9ACTN
MLLGGCLAAFLAPLVLAGLLYLGVVPLFAEDVSGDARSCGRSTAELGDALDHFGIRLPPGASAVRFSAGVNSLFGEYDLAVRFTTAPDRLADLLATLHLPALSPPDVATPLLPCTGAPGPVATVQQSEADLDGVHLTVQVDAADPAHPDVTVSAFDV